MSSIYKQVPPNGGGGAGAVDSVNGQTGDVIITKSSVGLGNVNNTSDATKNAAVATLTNKTFVDPGGAQNKLAGYNDSSQLYPVNALEIDGNSSGINQTFNLEPNDAGGYNLTAITANFRPLQNSPTDEYNILNVSASFDVDSSGFSQGTDGEVAGLVNVNANALGTGNIGQITLYNNYADLGNGTDPITVGGFLLSGGFADINPGVTILNNYQGYNFQPHFHAGAILTQDIQAYADFTNVECAANGYTSYFANPQILSIANNRNYQGFQNSPVITTFEGNAGYTGVGIFPNIGTINGNGNFQGVAVSPNITENRGNAIGLNVSMNGVHNFVGVKASLVVQDITYVSNNAGTDGNSLLVQYVNTTTAGNEVATLIGGNTIQVSIQSGVSIPAFIITALNNNSTISSNLTYTITGSSMTGQVTYAATHLAGGVEPGRSKAAQFDGDVSINGALSFTGGLSIGSLNSFAGKDLGALSPGVNSIDTLITAPNLAVGATITGSDLLAINTAMLLTMGDNSHATSNFLGFAALGLPAVLSMGTGSTIDQVSGAVFAISLDAGATGGTADTVSLCRALSLPNGVTTINKLRGYQFDLPFGDPGTVTHGFYASAGHNYMAGDLKVGTGSDVPANASVGIELTSTVKAFLPSRMTSTQRDALTAVDGMVLYNISTSKLQVRAAGAWVDLH